jgi:hypothetical protein
MCSVPELWPVSYGDARKLGLAEQQAEEYADRALSDYADLLVARWDQAHEREKENETITDYLARGGTVTRCPPQPVMGDLPGLYGVQREQARAAAAAGSRASTAPLAICVAVVEALSAGT